MTYNLVATCMFGLEKILGEEIDALGLHRTETIDGRIFFEGNENDIARANVFLRTAERVLVLARPAFEANTFEELFEGTKQTPWENFLPKNAVFPVSGHSVKSTLASVPSCQSIVKKAMCMRLGNKYGLNTLPEDGNLYKIEFFILKNKVYLMIDTTGVALHKRGYRPVANNAPLRETLAAAICLNARIREDIFLWDPFCGSGTVLIEGSMAAMHMAPGINRTFGGQALEFIPENAWKSAHSEACDLVKYDSPFRCKGTDIDPECISTAKENARRAGVLGHISFGTEDARKIRKTEGVRGTLICNPPYGERMMSMKDAENLYRSIGKNFAGFDPWQIYVLTSCEYFEKLYGRRADKKKKLYNGTIPCTLYQYIKPNK